MQGALDPGAVVQVKVPQPFDDILDHDRRDFLVGERKLAVDKAGGRDAPQIQDDLQQVIGAAQLIQAVADGGRQHTPQFFQVVSNPMLQRPYTFLAGSPEPASNFLK